MLRGSLCAVGEGLPDDRWRRRRYELDRSAAALPGNPQGGSLLPPGLGIRPVIGADRPGSGFRGRHVRGLHGFADRAGRARSDRAHLERIRRTGIPHQSRVRRAAAGRRGPRLRQRAQRHADRAGIGERRRVRTNDRGYPASAPLRPGRGLTSIEEGVGKMRAALAARQDPDLVIVGRTIAMGSTSTEDALARAKAYAAAGVDAFFFVGIKDRAQLEAAAAAIDIPIIIGGGSPELSDLDYLATKRVRVALQGHQPIMAAAQAVPRTLY